MIKLPILGALVSTFILAFSSTAFAHVTVKPGEVLTSSFQTFNVSVPNEKELPTVGIKLTIPSNVKYVTPTIKPGWEITTQKEGSGDSAVIKSITWSGGSIGQGFRDDFTFSAQVPAEPTELQWKAYQTYSDGTVVSWDKADSDHAEEGGDSGPFSITKVVTTTAIENTATNAENAAANVKDTANWALYTAITGVLVGLVGIFLATRKK